MITAADVTSANLKPTHFRAGYDPVDVDTLLARVRQSLEAFERRAGNAGGLTAAQVVKVRFRPTTFRAGYDQDDVDALLDRVVETLRAYEGAGANTKRE